MRPLGTVSMNIVSHTKDQMLSTGIPLRESIKL